MRWNGIMGPWPPEVPSAGSLWAVARTAAAIALTAPIRWAIRQHMPVPWDEGRVLCSPRLHKRAVDYPCDDLTNLQESATTIWEHVAGTRVPDYLP